MNSDHSLAHTPVEEELLDQPACWRQAAKVASRSPLPKESSRVAFVGCGTSYHVAQAVASWREASGWGESDAFTPSEMPLRRRYDVVVTVSRSGTTTEVLRLVEALPAGQEVLAITADAESPVARAARRCVALPFADEQAVVQTRFATSVLALWRAQFGHDVEGLSRAAEGRLTVPLPARLTSYRQFVFLGTGPGVGLAAEACLKFQEAALAWAESYAAMEFRHGPISLLDPGSLVWALGELPTGLAEEIRDSGATLEMSGADPMAELVRAQRAAVELAKSKGLDPSRPRRLSRSVVLS